MIWQRKLGQFAISAFRSNSDIRDFARKSLNLVDERSRRSAVRIAVIDDNPFAPQTNLQSYGYRITPIGDLKSLDEVADYNIVLCDLMGVGLHFDERNQGASLISEIKKCYPSKIVIAYTGAALNNALARSVRSRQDADAFLRKDADIEEWIECLDQYVVKAVDPFVIWQKTRDRLIELDADTKTIIVLEDAYVRSVLAKDATFGNMHDVLKGSGYTGNVRAVIQGLVSSLIFKAIFGG